MAEYFEFSLRNKVSGQEVRNFLVTYLTINVNNIVDEDAYWDHCEQKDLIGISIDHMPTGFKTRISGLTDIPLFDETLAKLAKAVAHSFDSEVVIGDYRAVQDDAQVRFLLFRPDGSVAEAIDDSSQGVNDVKIHRTIDKKLF